MYDLDLRPRPETHLTHVTRFEEDKFQVAWLAKPDHILYFGFSTDTVEADQRARLCLGATVEVTLWPELTPEQEEAERSRGRRIARVDGIPLPEPEDQRVESVFPRPLTQGKIGTALLWMRAKRWKRALNADILYPYPLAQAPSKAPPKTDAIYLEAAKACIRDGELGVVRDYFLDTGLVRIDELGVDSTTRKLLEPEQ